MAESAKFRAASEIIVDRMRRGASFGIAAGAARVTRQSVYRWVQRGRGGEEPFASWVVDLDEACSEASMRLIDSVMHAATKKFSGDWHAASFWLSRRYPHDWAEKEVLRQVANEAVENDEVELSIPVLENYLGRVGYKLVKVEKGATNDKTESEEENSGR